MAVITFVVSHIAFAAETAQSRLYCTSLRFSRGTGGPFDGTLDLSSYDPQTTINGELVEVDTPYTYESNFAMDDGLGDITYGTLFLNAPLTLDANHNGFPDFTESAQPVSANSTGHFSIPGVDSGSISVSWNRGAGSKDGTCTMGFTSSIFGSLGSYSCPFQLIEYTGPLTYTPGTNAVSANLSLSLTGDANQTIQGSGSFVKSSSNPSNSLTLQPGTWMDAGANNFTFTSASFLRRTSWPTNYYGFITFADGDPTTTDADYQVWVLSINDTNDANKNGIPDFSDAPAASMQLKLANGTNNNLLLTIKGGVSGKLHQIQRLVQIGTTNWQVASSVTITNPISQTVSLSFPTNKEAFYRVYLP